MPRSPGTRRSYHSCREWRECSGDMKCDSCGFKFSRGPCLFPGDRLDQGQRWRRHREGEGPRRGGGATQGAVPQWGGPTRRGRSLAGAVPRRRGGASGRGGAITGQSHTGARPQRGQCLRAGRAMEPLKRERSRRSRLQTHRAGRGRSQWPVEQVGGSDQSRSMSHGRNVCSEPSERASLGL